MSMKTKFLGFLMLGFAFLCFSFGTVSAQNDTAQLPDGSVDALELQLENLYGDGNAESEAYVAEDVLEHLEGLDMSVRPNLNELTYEVAVSVLQLSDFQYYQLQLYIERHGPLCSIYELAAIDGFSEEDMHVLALLTRVEPPPKGTRSFRELLKSSRHVFWTRYGQVLERQAGYDSARVNGYEGSPAHLQFRYDGSVSSHFGIRIAGEKDAGEAFFKGAQKYGFDHYSGSMYLKNVRWLKNVVVGDYRLNFGQGLVLGSSMMSGKGAGVDAVRRFGEGVRPVATTNESRLFRGMAFTMGNARWSGSGFAGGITESRLTAFGGALSYRRARFGAGAQVVCYGEYGDSAHLGDRMFALVHPKQLNVSVSYQAIVRKSLLFGEVASDENGKIALLQAALLPVVPVFRLAALLRYYSKGYQSPMGSGFRVSSGDCGEWGAYLTGHLVLSKNLEADMFCDYYRLRWLSYLVDAPVQGMDAGVSLTCRLPRRSILHVRYQWRTKPKNENRDEYLHRLMEQSRHRLRMQWIFTPLSFLKMKSEANMVFNRNSVTKCWSKGVLLYQDLAFNFARPQLSLHFRVAYFDTDSYDERLYAYENDVYYAFTIGSYYYQGMRAYLLLRYKVRCFSVWLRIGRTHYLNKSEISSGLTQIDKPHKTEVRVQCMVRI